MEVNDFYRTAQRLIDVWPNSFPEERLRLIKITVGDQESLWFEKLVNSMIANNRQAPLPQEFIEAVNMEGRKRYLEAQPQYKEFKSIFSDEEKKEMFKFLKLIGEGKINQEDAAKYAEVIASALYEKGVKPERFRLFNQNKIVYDKYGNRLQGDWE